MSSVDVVRRALRNGDDGGSMSRVLGVLATAVFVALGSSAANAVCSWTTLMNGTTANATQVMNNFDCLASNPSFSGTVGIDTAATSDILTIGSYTGSNNVVIGAGSAGWSSLYFGDGVGSDRYAGYIQYSHANDFLLIGTSKTDRVTINSSGTVRFMAYGAGTLTTDSAGNITASSDARLKIIDGKYSPGLSAIRGLMPVRYHWNELSRLDRSKQYAGFLAQNVERYIPEAVGKDSRGYLTLSDRPIQAALVNAIKELAALNEHQSAELRRLRETDARQSQQIQLLAAEISALKQAQAVKTASRR